MAIKQWVQRHFGKKTAAQREAIAQRNFYAEMSHIHQTLAMAAEHAGLTDRVVLHAKSASRYASLSIEAEIDAPYQK